MPDAKPVIRLPAVIIFLAVIALPLADAMVHFAPQAARSGRQVMEQEESSSALPPANFLQKLGRDFSERLFLRGTWIHWYNSLKFGLFRVSGVPRVIVGRKGWLFQARANREPGSAGYFPSVTPFSPQELADWKAALEQRRRWLQARGSDYLFIPVPDKSSVYPEYLPGNLRDFYRRSRLDQLVAYLKKNSSLPVLDIRPALLAAKKAMPVFARTDSHWNDPGARIVAGEIQRVLSLRLAGGGRLSFAGQALNTGKLRPGGNLAQMLTLENSFFMEERWRMSPGIPLRAKKAKLPRVKLSPTVAAEATENPAAPYASAVFLHDSFGRKLKPFLSEVFARVVYVRDWGFHFHDEVCETERPAIVLDEIAEHFLYNRLPVNPPRVKNGV